VVVVDEVAVDVDEQVDGAAEVEDVEPSAGGDVGDDGESTVASVGMPVQSPLLPWAFWV